MARERTILAVPHGESWINALEEVELHFSCVEMQEWGGRENPSLANVPGNVNLILWFPGNLAVSAVRRVLADVLRARGRVYVLDRVLVCSDEYYLLEYVHTISALKAEKAFFAQLDLLLNREVVVRDNFGKRLVGLLKKRSERYYVQREFDFNEVELVVGEITACDSVEQTLDVEKL